jgi:hypothetical protein
VFGKMDQRAVFTERTDDALKRLALHYSNLTASVYVGQPVRDQNQTVKVSEEVFVDAHRDSQQAELASLVAANGLVRGRWLRFCGPPAWPSVFAGGAVRHSCSSIPLSLCLPHPLLLACMAHFASGVSV